MFKKCFAAFLAVLMLFLCVGCGDKKPQESPESKETTTKALATEGEKIALLIAPQEDSPEVFEAASAISRAYGDGVLIASYKADYYRNAGRVLELAMATAEDPSVKTLIFADGVPGTLAAVKQVRFVNKDITIIVCNPQEKTAEFKDQASLVLGVDFAAMAKSLVQQAKSFGAENFVFYTTNRHLKNDYVTTLRSTVEDACKKEKITFKASACVDVHDSGRDLDTAKLYIAEDATRVEAKMGKKTALFCVDDLVQDAVAKAAADHGMYMAGTCMPSPLGLAAGIGVDMTDAHSGDSKYAMEQLSAKAKENKMSGHVATWGVSAATMFLQSAMDYADAKEKADLTVDSVTELLKAHSAGAEIIVKQQDDGAFVVLGDLITL